MSGAYGCPQNGHVGWLFGWLVVWLVGCLVGWLDFMTYQTFVGYLIPNPFSYKSSVLFQTIQFSMSTQFTSIKPINRALSGATIPGQIGPGSNGNEGVLCIPQTPSITGTSPSDFFSVISRTLVCEEGSYNSAEVQSVYSTAAAYCAINDQGFFLYI